jgi:predicted nucleic acid-binding protein
MAYIDTSVLVAYHFKEEERHQDAKSIVEELRKKGKQLFVSPLTVVELFSTISRNLPKYRLPSRLRRLSERTRIYILVEQILKDLSPVVVKDEPQIKKFNEIEAFHIFREAIDHAHNLKLRTLDLLHIIYALNLARKGLLDSLITLDEGIMEKKDILEELGLKVYGPKVP